MHNQDKNYFDTLYLENYRKLLIFVYGLLQDRYFAEEIVQDTFVVAYKKLLSYKSMKTRLVGCISPPKTSQELILEKLSG
jgi:DNA-directed RNA polymerase specialized sigma24 family protein